MKPSNLIRRAATALVAAALLASVVPMPAAAAVVDRGPVPSAARVGGVSLQGMSEANARSLIIASVEVPRIVPFSVTVVGKRRFMLNGQNFVSLNVSAMLDAAYASTATVPFDLAPVYAYDTGSLRSWCAAIVSRYEKPAVDSRRIVRNRRLVVTPSATGVTSDHTKTYAGVLAALKAAVASGQAQRGQRVELTVALPKVTQANIGKAILVVLGERKVYLYNNVPVQRTFRCAIGQARYPTPTGTFRIVAKAANPAWHNPGSDWARNMPAYIPPGPNNPLGLRALYLNVSGIRIHGTNKIGSIGSPASHGCIRLANSDIVQLFPLVPVGTPVYIIR